MKTLIKIPIPSFLVPLILALACFELPPKAQAVSPAPDGGYPGGNTAEGQKALSSLTTGGFNTAVGYLSLRSNSTNSFNTALGAGALLANTADSNTATGAGALFSNTTGTPNTANGAFALFSNTGGDDNTATGDSALFSNTTGSHNTATGYQALLTNTIGSENTADGVNALAFNTTGSFNTANGYQALFNNTTGPSNTANGFDALFSNTTGGDNTANGFKALFNNTAGYYNTAIGFEALVNTTGQFNTAIGFDAGYNQTTGNNNVYIGAEVAGVPGENDACYIISIFGQTTASGTPVFVDSNNKLGTTSSAKRFKSDIKPMDKTSEAILALKPVRFQYKSDSKGTPQFGLIAEEVEKVNPDLVVRDKEGKPYSVRYDQVNAMLLNEFLKEHRKVEQMQKQIDALTAGLQKVSAQIEVSKPAPKTVLNDQ